MTLLHLDQNNIDYIPPDAFASCAALTELYVTLYFEISSAINDLSLPTYTHTQPVLDKYMYQFWTSTCTSFGQVHVPVLDKYMYQFWTSTYTSFGQVHVPVLDKYIYQFWTSTYTSLDKYIYQFWISICTSFGQVHVPVLDKYICQFWTSTCTSFGHVC